MIPDPIRVAAAWDAEAGAWIAESEDLPGFVTKAPTLEALVERIAALVAALLAALAEPRDARRRVQLEACRTVELAA